MRKFTKSCLYSYVPVCPCACVWSTTAIIYSLTHPRICVYTHPLGRSPCLHRDSVDIFHLFLQHTMHHAIAIDKGHAYANILRRTHTHIHLYVNKLYVDTYIGDRTNTSMQYNIHIIYIIHLYVCEIQHTPRSLFVSTP